MAKSLTRIILGLVFVVGMAAAPMGCAEKKCCPADTKQSCSAKSCSKSCSKTCAKSCHKKAPADK